MRTFRILMLGALFGGVDLLCMVNEASAQRGRFGRVIVSPWYDAQPPLGPAGNSPWRYGQQYYTPPTYTRSATPPVTTTTTANAGRAEIRINVHPDADVFVNGELVGQRGTNVRVFHTPPLERGWAYTYRVTARWNQAVGMISHDRTVSVVPGEQRIVDFTQPPASEFTGTTNPRY